MSVGKRNCDTAKLNSTSNFPAMYIVIYCIVTIVQLSLKFTVLQYERTALHCAAANGKTKCVQHLCNSGANIDAKDAVS